MKILYVIFASFLAASCSTMNHTKVVEYNKAIPEKYPPVSIIVNDGYVHSEMSCYATGCYGYRDGTSRYILNIMRLSELFSDLHLNKLESPYSININTRFRDRDGDSIGKLFLGIFTLFLIPTSSYYVADADISVCHKGNLIDSYSYSTEVEDVNFLFVPTELYKRDAMEIILSMFFRDIENNNPFSVPTNSSRTVVGSD